MLPQPALPSSDEPVNYLKAIVPLPHAVPSDSLNRKRRASTDATSDEHQPAKRTRIEDHAAPAHSTLTHDEPSTTKPLGQSNIESSDDEPWPGFDEDDQEDFLTHAEQPVDWQVDVTSAAAAAATHAKVALPKGLSLSSSSPPSTDVDGSGSADSAHSNATSLITTSDEGYHGDIQAPLNDWDGSVASMFPYSPTAFELEPL